MLKTKLFQTAKQFTKYGIVGVINTTITLVTIFVFMKLAGVSYLIANAVGYVLGFLNSFILNKLWTFRSNKPFAREGMFFILMFAICYSLQLLFLIFLKEKLQISPEYAQVIAMIFYAILNFAGNKMITFKS